MDGKITCPVCKNPRPIWSSDKWACRHCNSEMDRKGKLIKKNEEGLKEYEEKLEREEYLKERGRLKARKEVDGKG